MLTSFLPSLTRSLFANIALGQEWNVLPRLKKYIHLLNTCIFQLHHRKSYLMSQNDLLIYLDFNHMICLLVRSQLNLAALTGSKMSCWVKLMK